CSSRALRRGGSAPPERNGSALRARAAGPRVRAELGAGVLVANHGLVELGSVLDLLLPQLVLDLLLVGIDAGDHARGKHDSLPEDPRAGVDDDVAGADVVARLVDPADAAVHRLDLVPGQIGGRPRLLAERPDLESGHHHAPFSSSVALV